MAFADTDLPKHQEIETTFNFLNTKVQGGDFAAAAPDVVEGASLLGKSGAEPALVSAYLVAFVISPGPQGIPDAVLAPALSPRGIELFREIEAVRFGDTQPADATPAAQQALVAFSATALKLLKAELAGVDLDKPGTMEPFPGLVIPTPPPRAEVTQMVDSFKGDIQPLAGRHGLPDLDKAFDRALGDIQTLLRPAPAPASSPSNPAPAIK